MCTVVVTTMDMPMPHRPSAAATAAPHGPGVAPGVSETIWTADVLTHACASCTSMECGAMAGTLGVALMGLLLLLLRRGSQLFAGMRPSLPPRLQVTWRSPALHLAPIRYELCVLRT